MGRARTKSRAGWPANLYPNRAGFKYRHPVSRKESWMGTDKARAFAAAKQLNALLMPSGDLLARVGYRVAAAGCDVERAWSIGKRRPQA